MDSERSTFLTPACIHIKYIVTVWCQKPVGIGITGFLGVKNAVGVGITHLQHT